MKIEAKVRGFRGAERADIVIEPICLCSGVNAAGKSSIAQAVAAACAGTAIPFYSERAPDKPLLTKKDGKELLSGGVDKGSVEILIDGKVANSARWPALEWEGDGRLHCSLYAVGLLDAMRLPDAERQKFFAELLKATPNEDDLRLAVMEAVPALGDENSGEQLKKLLDMVSVSGFDSAHAMVKEAGAKRKGMWEAASGEAWGIKKADGWKPKDWREDLETKSLEDIGTECTTAQAAVDAARAKMAVDAATIEALRDGARNEAGLWDALQTAEKAFEAARREHAKGEEALAALVVPHALPCPHCGGMVDVQVKPGSIKLAEATMSAAEILVVGNMRASVQQHAEKLAEAADEAGKIAQQARMAHNQIAGSAEKLKVAEAKKGSQEAVDLAADLLAGLNKDKALIASRLECTRLFSLIVANQKLVDILAPDGLRRQKLVKALAKLNTDIMANLCAEAKYPAVTLDHDLEVLYGGRRYFLLSQSEQYRVKAVLQLAIAMYDGSPLVIYDGADVLDPAGRNGLFKMMQYMSADNADTPGKSFLVCMTIGKLELVPDLAKAGIGITYWVKGGIASAIDVAKA